MAAALVVCNANPAFAAYARHVRSIAGMDVRLATAIVCALMFTAIPATCYVSLKRRNIVIPRSIGLFLISATTCGIAYATYIFLFLFDHDAMRVVGIAALLLMFFTILTLLPLIPALVSIYDPERERLAGIVNSSKDAIIGKDVEGNITSWNHGAQLLYGFSREEAIGQHIRLIVPPDRYHELEEIMQSIQRGEVVADMETERRSKLGDQVFISLSISPVRDRAGEIVGASAIGRDITTRRRMEQRLLESNKALDDFAHVASHDLKSPLRGIDNLCRFIEEDLNDEAAASVSEHLARMHGRVHRMEKLLDDLLEYSRVGRGEQRVQKIGVATLVSNVTRLLDVPAGFHVCTKDPLPVLTTFVTPLEQVFRNLIHNAIKHHDSDHGRIVVSAVECGRLVEFTVRDDGPGIAPQFHDRIFRMFTTLAPRDEVEGSGLGLPLIVKLTRHYGGDVWLDESANGERGAIFRFTWPKTVMEDTV